MTASTPQTGLRARRHRQTRTEIAEAAIALFDAHGYANVTMDDIAVAADISRRTLYRYFPTKERILLDPPGQWLATWDAVTARLPDDAPSLTVVEAAARAVAEVIDADADQLRATWRIIQSVPALEPAFLANPAWIERAVALLTDPARGPDVPLPIAYTVAGAYAGAVDATMARWASADDDTTVVAAIEALLDHLRPIWPRAKERQRHGPSH